MDFITGLSNQNEKVFKEITQRLPPIRENEHDIKLITFSHPPNIKPCHYPYARKSEIDNIVKDVLEASIICPSESGFSS